MVLPAGLAPDGEYTDQGNKKLHSQRQANRGGREPQAGSFFPARGRLSFTIASLTISEITALRLGF